ncbi:hypothetical protein C0V76_19410 [Uliginosibacterium sp. TH139]|nr:hypothetical protein C0V76_19410 [Uliginosibacterium sp. TH139]
MLAAADVSPEKYELHSVTKGATSVSSSSKVTTYSPTRTYPYYSRWLTLQFQIVPEDLNEIEIVFPAGTVSLEGEVIELAPFRFHKTTKSDIYYSSFNC